MDETKISEMAMNDQPMVVQRASQMPKGFRLAKPSNYTNITENEIEIYPANGDITFTSSKHILYDISVSKERMKFIYGPATYHSFKITISDNDAILDATSNCVFREMRLSGSGPGQLEQCDNVNVLNNILLDCTVNPIDRRNYFSFFGGNKSFGTIAAAADVTYFNECRQGLEIATDEYAYLLQIIPSGLIGAFQQKLFPISECGKSLRLDFKLEDDSIALKNTTDAEEPIYSLTECRLKVCLIELSDLLSDALRSIYDGIFVIPYDSWTQYPSTIVSNNSNTNINVSSGLKYLKAIVASFRPDTFLVYNERSLSSRAKFHMTQYNWKVNGKTYPSDVPIYMEDDAELAAAGTGPPDDARGFIQVMKVFNNLPSTHATCSFSLREFNSTCTTAAGLGIGAFLAAVNLEYPDNDPDYRTTTDSTSNNIVFKYRTETAPTQNIYVDFFLWYSAEAYIENGVVTANY